MSRGESRLAEYDYDLPADRIAQRPTEARTDSRLLRWKADGDFAHHRFGDVTELLHRGDLLVLNDTRVFPARLFGRKSSGGGAVEVLLLRPLEGTEWEAMVRPGRRLSLGAEVVLEGDLRVRIGDRLDDGRRRVDFPVDSDVWAHCEEHGAVPLPPYVDRPAEVSDRARYQTVFAEHRGSVAAPTAGLHFDEALLRGLREAGVRSVRITLHVGPGTFQPLDASRLARGELHPEFVSISSEVIETLRRQREGSGRIVAVGTTVCRALESLPDIPPAEGFETATRLLIQPGHRFRWVDVLITNFHLPRSSLLLLVAAFAGERWREAYRTALDGGYRFYSYGDANWIEPAP